MPIPVRFFRREYCLQMLRLTKSKSSIKIQMREVVHAMPELCRFYNIVIKMIYSDDGQHHKPHFHVYFAEYEASVGVDGELLAGSLPVKQLKLVQAWAAIHEDELYAAWNNAVRNIPFGRIEPLR